MPTLSDFESVVPFLHIGELVEAANAVLAKRPHARVNERTVRYYISPAGLVPRPLGTPKNPRYGMEHLARLVAARILVDQGKKQKVLGPILDEVFELGLESGMRTVQEWLDAPTERVHARAVAPFSMPAPLFESGVYESKAFESPAYAPRQSEVRPAWHIPLAPGIMLVIEGGLDADSGLREAYWALRKRLEDTD